MYISKTLIFQPIRVYIIDLSIGTMLYSSYTESKQNIALFWQKNLDVKIRSETFIYDHDRFFCIYICFSLLVGSINRTADFNHLKIHHFYNIRDRVAKRVFQLVTLFSVFYDLVYSSLSIQNSKFRAESF